MILTVCLDSTWVLEQPGGTLLEYYPRWRWMLLQLSLVAGRGAVTLMINPQTHVGRKALESCRRVKPTRPVFMQSLPAKTP